MELPLELLSEPLELPVLPLELPVALLVELPLELLLPLVSWSVALPVAELVDDNEPLFSELLGVVLWELVSEDEVPMEPLELVLVEP